jgi:hypothetical protein
MSEFTKGPWKAIEFGAVGDGITKVVSDRPNEDFGFGRWICNAYGNEDADLSESEANARLIASAPDLLDILQRIHGQLSQMVFYDSFPELCYDADAAINKALGIE